MSNEQLSLFLNNGDADIPLPPSEAYRLAHPEDVEPEVTRTEWDPNARRAARQRGAGGGFAAAAAGEIELSNRDSSPKIDSIVHRQSIDRRTMSSYGRLMADREPDTEHDPAYKSPVELDERTKEIGRMGVANAKKILEERKRNK